MSTRANPTVIGLFVLGAAVLLVAALLLWGGTGLFKTKLDYVLFFDTSVVGLNRGAPVTFQGVRVGEVTDIQVRWGTTLVAVYIALQPDALKGIPTLAVRDEIQRAVQSGLRAQLKTQSLVTGVLYIALIPEPDKPIVLRGLDPKTPELPTIPTDVEVWAQRIEKFADRIEALPLQQIVTATAETLEEARRILKSPETAHTLRNVDQLIADARQAVARLDALARDVDGQVSPLAAASQDTLKAAQAALAEIPGLVQDARQLIAKVDARAEPLLASVQSTSESARATLDQARSTLGGVDGTMGQTSPLGYDLAQLLRELREAARAVRSLADYLERMPDAAVYGVRRPAEGGQ